MPGRLIMETPDSAGLNGLKRERSHALENSKEPDHKKSMTHQSNAHAETNGHASPFPRQHGGGSDAPSLTNGSNHVDGMAVDDAPVNDRLPPELEHFTESYVPFGKLLERIAQQANSDLNETIDAMADILVPQEAPMVNGATSQAPLDKSAASVDKKLRLMNYAQTHKDRFIKALVLADWARNMDDINRLIELCMWLRQQDELTQSAADGVVRLKHNMIAAKMPNPNLEGAFEVLSTGKAAWMPDLGYIRPDPLSAEKLLQTLQDMNFTLAARLNLHEDLPRHFNDYTISDGRATFVVPGEFEVDLATTDEDPASPFYFIDLRFLFTPSSSFTNDRLRTQLEGKVNELLVSGGLQACYDFLHGFVLTHKLNIFRCQANEMARSIWAQYIDISMVHRSVIIQYWKDQRTGNNWIELGITSGKGRKTNAPGINHPPQISCRWFRRGQEIVDPQIDLDTNNLSMQDTLDHVIAKHVNGRLNALSQSLTFLANSSNSFKQILTSSSSNAGDCSLRLELESAASPITVGVQPVTGNYSISPRTAFSAETEERLNSDLNVDPGLAVQHLVCRELQEQIASQARNLGWSAVHMVRQSNLKDIFEQEHVRRSVFGCKGWGAGWALAATINLGGSKWWIVKLESDQHGSKFVNAERLHLLSASTCLVSRMFRGLEKLAVAQMSISSIIEHLRRRGIPNEAQSPSNVNGTPRETQRTHPQIFIDANKLLGTANKDDKRNDRNWCKGIVTVTHQGMRPSVDYDADDVVHTVRFVLGSHTARILLPHLRKCSEAESDIFFGNGGKVKLSIRTPLGSPVLPSIISKMLVVKKLSSFVRIAVNNHFSITAADPTRIEFCYASDPALTAELQFPIPGSAQTKIYLNFSVKVKDQQQPNTSIPSNPHSLIHIHLEAKLNSDLLDSEDLSDHDFSNFCQILRFTWPLLRTLSALTDADPYARTIFHVHDSVTYKLQYRPPLLQQSFSITARPRNGKVFWFVKDVTKTPGPNREVNKQLHDLWNANGNGWNGLKNGACADASGIEELLKNIDGIIRPAKVENVAVVAADVNDTALKEPAKMSPEMKRPQQHHQQPQNQPPRQQYQQQPKQSQQQQQKQRGKKGEQGNEIVVLD